MKKLLRLLAKPLLWIFTCAIPVVIAACYGVYQDFFHVSGRVVDKETGDGLGNIQVTCLSKTGDETDSTHSLPGDGYFELRVDFPEDCSELLFEDVDEMENGGRFKTLTTDYNPENDEETFGLDQEE